MSHYSCGQKPERLGEFVNAAAPVIVEAFQGTNKVPVLIYTGLSGISAATALMLKIHSLAPLMRMAMVYVRKEGEKSHGDSIESEFLNCNSGDGALEYHAVFVDDFVASGTTFRRCLQQAQARYPALRWRPDSFVLSSTLGMAQTYVARAKDHFNTYTSCVPSYLE